MADEMLEYNVEIIALHELRWKEQGRIDKPDCTLIYSRSEENYSRFGTGFITKKMRKFNRICSHK